MQEFEAQSSSPNPPVADEAMGAEALTVEQAIANLTHPDLSLRYYAAWWLGKFASGLPSEQKAIAVETLIAALTDDADRTELGGYPLRRNAARALGKLGDRRAVPGLIDCLTCDDFYVREAAAQALGLLADPAAIDPLMTLLEGGVAAAQLVPGRPHLTQPVEAVLEALGSLGATAAIPLIQPFLNHAVVKIQYAAARALYQLTEEAVYAERLIQALQGGDVQLRRSALADLGATGYLPAAEAIATAPTENSFKLLALKGLLERQLREAANGSLSAGAVQVMGLMDSLL